MLMMQKPKIGFLGLMQGLYDKSQPELPKMQEKFALQVVEQLKDVADVDFPGPAKEREDIERYVKMFNDKEYDGIMIVNLLYSPGNRLIQAMKKNRLPVLVANIQPRPDVTKEWDWILCTTNQGIHGCQDTCNVLMRCGVKPAIITEDWKSDNFKKLFSDWAYAANTCIRLKKTKLAIFGRMHNMGDILGDDAALCRKFGVEANHETIGPVYYAMESITDAEIDAQIEEDKKNFKIDPKLPAESHRYAARMIFVRRILFCPEFCRRRYQRAAAHCDRPHADRQSSLYGNVFSGLRQRRRHAQPYGRGQLEGSQKRPGRYSN